MSRLRWWIGRHPENAAYLLIVCLVAGLLAGLLAIAVIRGGGW